MTFRPFSAHTFPAKRGSDRLCKWRKKRRLWALWLPCAARQRGWKQRREGKVSWPGGCERWSSAKRSEETEDFGQEVDRLVKAEKHTQKKRGRRVRRGVDGFFFRVIQNSDTIHYFCMKMKGGEESRKFWRTLASGGRNFRRRCGGWGQREFLGGFGGAMSASSSRWALPHHAHVESVQKVKPSSSSSSSFACRAISCARSHGDGVYSSGRWRWRRWRQKKRRRERVVKHHVFIWVIVVFILAARPPPPSPSLHNPVLFICSPAAVAAQCVSTHPPPLLHPNPMLLAPHESLNSLNGSII